MDETKHVKTLKGILAVAIAAVAIVICVLLLRGCGDSEPVINNVPTEETVISEPEQLPSEEPPSEVVKETVSPSEVLPSYNVIFVDYNGRILSEATYEEGAALEEPSNVTKQIKWGNYIYTFAGWNGDYAGMAVESTTYEPIYERVATLFADDFTGDIPGENPDQTGWTFSEGPNGAVVDVVLDGSNEILYIYRTTASATGEDKATPRAIIEGVIIPKNADRLVVEYDVRTDSDMRSAFSSYKPSNALISKVKSEGEWSHVKIEVDLTTGSFVSYVNGEEKESGVLEGENALKLGEKQQFRFTAGNVYDAAGVYIDNVVMEAYFTLDLNSKEPAVYNINFMDYYGNIVQASQIEEGETVVVPADPGKEDNDWRIYYFRGWRLSGSDDVENLLAPGKVLTPTGSATYKAYYDVENVNYYKIAFKDFDGTVLTERKYREGSELSGPDNVTKEIKWGYYTYTFAGWGPDFTGEAKKDATYEPVYTRATTLFEDDFTGDTVGENPDQDGWVITEGNNDAAIDVKQVGSNEALYIYRSKAYLGDEEYVAKYNGATPRGIVNVTIPEDADKLVVEFDVMTQGELKASFSSYSPSNTFISKISSNDKWSHVKVEVNLANGNYVSYVNGEKKATGTLSSDKLLKLGEPQEFRFVAGYIKDAEGIYIDNIIFTAEYELDTNALEYTVEFQNHEGTTIGKETYMEGDPVDAPETIAEEIKWGLYTYKFTGWTPEFTGIAKEDTVYKPVYERTDVIFADDFTNDTVDEAPDQEGWTVVAKSNNAAVEVEVPASGESGNALYIHRSAAYAGTDEYVKKTHGATPSASVNVTIPESAEKLTVEFDVLTQGSLQAAFASRNPANDFINKVDTADAWTHVKVEIDLDSGYVSYLEGKEVNAVDFTSETLLNKGEPQEFRFTAGYIREAEGIYIDNIAFTAHYTADTSAPEPETCTVTFKYENGTTAYEQEYLVGGAITLPATVTAPEKADYIFKGWKLQQDSTEGDAVYFKEGDLASGNATYVAYYEEKVTYTITFLDHTGKEIKSETLDEGTAITTPADQTRADEENYTYVFVGWKLVNTDGSLGANLTSDAKVSANATYKATYVEVDKITGRTVLFTTKAEDLKTGADGSIIETALSDTKINDFTQIEEVIKSATGEKVLIAVGADGEEEVLKVFADTEHTEGTSYTTASFYREVNIEDLTNLTIEYKLKTSGKFGKSMLILQSKESDGWDNGEKTLELNTTEWITVKAELTKGTDTWSYKLTSTDASGTATEHASADNLTLTDDIRLWFRNRVKQSQYVYYDDIKVYTTAEATKYAIKFLDEEGETIENTSKNTYSWEVEEGADVTVPAMPREIGTDEVFVGWQLLDADGNPTTDTPIAPAASLKAEGNATYKAVYKKQYTIKFVDHDSSEIKSEKLDAGTTITVPADLTRVAGEDCTYEFVGWKLVNADGSLGANLTADTKATASVTYKATYVEIDKIVGRTVLFTTKADDLKTEEIKDAEENITYRPVAAESLAAAKINDFTTITENIDAEKGYEVLIRTEGDKTDKVLKVYAGSGHTNESTNVVADASRVVDISEHSNLTVEYAVGTSAKVAKSTVILQKKKASGDWENLTSYELSAVTTEKTVRIELIKDTATDTWNYAIYIDGSENATASGSGLGLSDELNVLFRNRIKKGGYVYYDDIKIYATEQTTPEVTNYTINFVDYNGDTINGIDSSGVAYTQTVKEGDAITVPAAPTRTEEGCVWKFAGWKKYENSTIGDAIDTNPTATADATYIATYDKYYTVKFLNHAGNEIGTDGYSLEVKEDNAITAPTGPARTDDGTEAGTYYYEFTGWKLQNTAEGVETYWSDGTTATASMSFIATYNKVLFKTDCSNLTVGGTVAEGSTFTDWTDVQDSSATEGDTKKLYVQGATDAEKGTVLYVFRDKDGTGKGGIWAERNVDVTGLTKLTLVFDYKTNSIKPNVYYENGSSSATLLKTASNSWKTVKVEIVIADNQFTVYVDGTQSGEAKTLDGNTFTFGFSVNSNVAAEQGVYYDDIKIYGQ